MTSSVDSFNIEKLKVNFENIISLKQEIVKTKADVLQSLQQMKTDYQELLKLNTKKILLFCLDSFYFQYKYFAMEIDNIEQCRVLINNRMYCDYYKLYNIIITDIKEKRNEIQIDAIIKKDGPIYKDLEPFQEYKIDDIRLLHSNIMLLINELFIQANTKITTIHNYNEKSRIGFSISNFINTLEYDNRLLNEQISLYINYLSFFHISQKKLLKRLHSKLVDFFKEVNENVNINQTFSIEDIQEEKKLSNFFSDSVQLTNSIEIIPQNLQPEKEPEPVIQRILTTVDLSGSKVYVEGTTRTKEPIQIIFEE